MKGKTKKRIRNGSVYALVGVFVVSTLLLYLPVSAPAPEAESPEAAPPSLEEVQQEAQQGAPDANEPAETQPGGDRAPNVPATPPPAQ